MTSEETKMLLQDVKKVKKPGNKLVQIQKEEWDPLGFDPDAACKELDNVDPSEEGIEELLSLRKEFMLTAMRSYVEATHNRRPAVLEKDKMMDRETLWEFFDVCNTKMDLPETHEMLLAHLEKTQKAPNELIMKAQRDILEDLGFEADHGSNQLGMIPQNYPGDKELLEKLKGWQMKAEHTFVLSVLAYQKDGRELPSAFNMPDMPGMEDVVKQAESTLDNLDEKGIEALWERMKPKVEIFMKLPPPKRQDYLRKLADNDKVDFLMAQMMSMKEMRKSWKAQQEAMQTQMQEYMKTKGKGKGDGAPQAVGPMGAVGPYGTSSLIGSGTGPYGGKSSAPSQQTM
eukprot:TRINITY_DN8810_c0_g1_i1.p1 TRINITY_DN8810_c0_g1~~TRINITY_DN8810_c0_g1_i1.p1  ORF type:complete len:384 (-),score=86.74 TRINITY_DN8810_c0_g1_i1:219-1247(-)